VGSVGFLVGLCVGVPITAGLYGVYFNATTVAIGALGTAIALLYCEKRRHLPTADDVMCEASWNRREYREHQRSLKSGAPRGRPAAVSGSEVEDRAYTITPTRPV
jgi:hypothetical protein